MVIFFFGPTTGKVKLGDSCAGREVDLTLRATPASQYRSSAGVANEVADATLAVSRRRSQRARLGRQRHRLSRDA